VGSGLFSFLFGRGLLAAVDPRPRHRQSRPRGPRAGAGCNHQVPQVRPYLWIRSSDRILERCALTRPPASHPVGPKRKVKRPDPIRDHPSAPSDGEGTKRPHVGRQETEERNDAGASKTLHPHAGAWGREGGGRSVGTRAEPVAAWGGNRIADARLQMPDWGCQIGDVRLQMPDGRCQARSRTKPGSRRREPAQEEEILAESGMVRAL